MGRTAQFAKQRKKLKFKIRRRNRCRICGRPRAFLRKFEMCRICFRVGAQGRDSRRDQGQL